MTCDKNIVLPYILHDIASNDLTIANVTLYEIILNQMGITPLIAGAGAGHTSTVTLLLDAKAVVDHPSIVRLLSLT